MSAVGLSAADRVAAAYERITAVDRPEIWITLRPREDAVAEAKAIDARTAAGARLPLAGLVAAVKDNIDVAGLPTTAAARVFTRHPEVDATAVARLRAAGAIVLGKTNLDQFATGLVGTRSPFGAVRNAWDPARISGGSSSGSAVAVALGIVDVALGTDTAGSGRVPAALNGIVGVKPTRGIVAATGVVPACRSLDCVTVFARDLALARRTAELLTGPDVGDPLSRDDRPTPAPAAIPRIGIPLPAQLEGMAPGWAEAFAAAADRFAASGAELVEVDIAPLLAAAALLYDGAFVAERTAAVGDVIAGHPELVGTDLDPTVAAIIRAGEGVTAVQAFRDRERLDVLAALARETLAGTDALLTPTTTGHPTLAEVAADPIGSNSRLGRFTNFANLLDMAALAVPAGVVDGLPFGVMLSGPAFSDRALAALAQRVLAPRVELAVFGAHLRGQPLNRELVALGGSYLTDLATAPSYRLHVLDTTPAKPGVVRVADGGASIAGERWSLPAEGLGMLAATLPAPMTLGRVRLADGSELLGFGCEPIALEGAADITSWGGWAAWLAAGGPAPAPAE